MSKKMVSLLACLTASFCLSMHTTRARIITFTKFSVPLIAGAAAIKRVNESSNAKKNNSLWHYNPSWLQVAGIYNDHFASIGFIHDVPKTTIKDFPLLPLENPISRR